MGPFNISEIFCTIQGEGRNAGRPCVFLRFTGCNLWRNKDVPSLTCPWCDTPQLFNSEQVTGSELRARLDAYRERKEWGLVITGGEPLLQLTPELLNWCLHVFQWVDIETNGTQSLSEFQDIRNNVERGAYGLHEDQLTFSCSPKTGKYIKDADQYKILIPDKKMYVEDAIRAAGVQNVFLQPVEPKDGIESDEYERNLQETIELAYETGARVCIQQHKYLNLP